MSKKEGNTLVIEKLDEVLTIYGTDGISVDLNEMTGNIDINECHRSWSDVIAKDIVSKNAINKRSLIKALNKRNVGYCL